MFECWRVPEGSFLVQGDGGTCIGLAGVRFADGTEVEKGYRYWQVSAAGTVLRVFGHPRSDALDDVLYVTSVHRVFGDWLMEVAAEEYPDRRECREKVILSGLIACGREELPFDVEMVERAEAPTEWTPAVARKELEEAMKANAKAQAAWGAMAENGRELCLRWVADAAITLFRVDRVKLLASSLWAQFDPLFDLGGLTFIELERRFGKPRWLRALPPRDQEVALREGRVLEWIYTRNNDNSRVTFGAVREWKTEKVEAIIEQQKRRRSMFAYTWSLYQEAVDYLNYNRFDNERALEGEYVEEEAATGGEAKGRKE